MSEMKEPTETPRGWAARHKILLSITGGFLLLVLAVVLGGVYYIRSGRLNHYIASQVQTALLDYGVRADIGGLDLSWGIRTAKAHDIKLYNLESGQIIATIDSAE